MSQKIRVRYAPSPTGDLHIGNARTALFNYLFARHHGGEFIIRIEDTDLKRNLEHGEQSQMDNLSWLGIDWDESPEKPGEYGPYRQSERLHIYQPLIEQLLAEDKAYKCYMTEEELEQEREAQKTRGEMPHYGGQHAHLTKEQEAAFEAEGRVPVIRFRVPENVVYEFDDIVKGLITFESKNISGDWVIQKRDGMPTYNFAVTVDDHFMKITHVLRGDDHVANTPKQLVVYEAFGWKAPEFGHMSLIINTETGKKLSKRDETVLQFIEQYRELGYLPDAMFNFITLLGWSPVGESEIFNQREFIKMFDPNRLSKSPAAFDIKKLEWINNQYVKAANSDVIADSALKQLIKAGKIEENPDTMKIEWARQLTSLYKQQMSYTGQIVEMADVFFSEPDKLDDAAKEELAVETAPVVLKEFAERVKKLPIFDATEIQNTIKAIQKETKIRGRQLYMPIRIATTRAMHGPDLAPSIELLGREKALKHLEQTLKEIGA